MSTFKFLPQSAKINPVKLAISTLSCCLVYGQCYAEEISSNASVNLLFGLTLTEDRELDFGTLSGGTAANCNIDNASNLSGSATGCTGTGTTGQFTVRGIRFFQVTVSVTPGSQDGITFTPSFANGATSLSGFLPNAGGIFGEASLTIIGGLSWAGPVSGGAKQIPYTFTADYN